MLLQLSDGMKSSTMERKLSMRFCSTLEKCALPEMWKSFMLGPHPSIGRDLSDEVLLAMEKDIQARVRPVAIMQV